MSWFDKTQIADDLAATDTEVFSDAVELKSDETVHVQVQADFPDGPTDALEVRVYTSLDATSETWDNTTFATAKVLANSTDPGRWAFTVTGVYKFRVGFLVDGASDEVTCNAWYRSNGNYKDCHLDL